jgi:hypothetical protein
MQANKKVLLSSEYSVFSKKYFSFFRDILSLLKYFSLKILGKYTFLKDIF